MKHKSATSNYSGSVTPFQDAAKAVARAWRKKYGYRVPVPALSHALSIFEGDTWRIACAETGETLATVVEGMAALVEDPPD